MSEPATVSVSEVQLFERDVTFRMPFRFGVVTLTASPQAFARVRIRDGSGREGWAWLRRCWRPSGSTRTWN